MSAAADSTGFADAEAPLAEPDRIAALDVLRGFALLGIFIMNMPGFSHSLFAAPTPPANVLDASVAALRDLFFAGKFNLLFGFVFGVGFAIQMARLGDAERARAARLAVPARPNRPAHVYCRRLAFLAVVGLVHAMLLWSGDVLVIYALLGFALLALRRLDDRGFASLIAACLLFPALAEVLRPVFFSVATETIAAFEYQQLEASNDLAFGHGSFADAVRETARVFAWSVRSPLGLYAFLAFGVQMATGILAGYVVGRRSWPARATSPSPPLRLLAAALVVAIGGNAIAAIGAEALATVLDERLALFITVLTRTFGRAALAALYVLAVVRLVGAGGAPPAWLRPLQQVGRMPLTNYLLQTLLATFCFYGWGLGWWGRGGAAFETALAIALFVCVQLPFAAAWLSRHRAGPVEALWRFFTYGARRG
ncbi:MAG TPA: DUF418 domain-containing protein [Caldimonas sp.]